MTVLPGPYSIDTSALVDWWVRYYPPKAFPGLVPRVEQLIASGELRASREVREELERENDALLAWVKEQDDLCVESNEAIQAVVATLMGTYYNPEKPDKGINGADPFVIGLAAIQNPQQWTVVSGEKPGSAENPKIPWACLRYKPNAIRHLSFLELIVEQGWKLT